LGLRDREAALPLKALSTSTGIVATIFLIVPAIALGDVSPAERELVRALSDVRAQHGLAPLRGSRALARSAGRYSRWQLRNGYFGHQPRIRMSGSFSLRGEVLRLVPSRRLRIRRTVRVWMRSPSHRSAILHPGMRQAGAGIARGRFRGRRALIVTVHLGAR
jgi:uncharacterized protein YkwD